MKSLVEIKLEFKTIAICNLNDVSYNTYEA